VWSSRLLNSIVCILSTTTRPRSVDDLGQLEARLKRGFQPLIELLETGLPTGDPARSGVARCAPTDRFEGVSSRRPACCATTSSVRRRKYPSSDTADRPARQPSRERSRSPKRSSRSSRRGSVIGQRGTTMPNNPSCARPLDRAVRTRVLRGDRGHARHTAGAATFVGHATVLLTGPRTRLLIDPFLLPDEASVPDGLPPARLRPTRTGRNPRHAIPTRITSTSTASCDWDGTPPLCAGRVARVRPRCRHVVPSQRAGIHSGPSTALARRDDGRRLPGHSAAVLRRAAHH
jgi:hypothetical protein